MRKIRSEAELLRLWEAQRNEVERVRGKRAADLANYGWGTDFYETAAKVYSTGCSTPPMVLTSGFVGPRVVHTWKELEVA